MLQHHSFLFLSLQPHRDWSVSMNKQAGFYGLTSRRTGAETRPNVSPAGKASFGKWTYLHIRNCLKSLPGSPLAFHRATARIPPSRHAALTPGRGSESWPTRPRISQLPGWGIRPAATPPAPPPRTGWTLSRTPQTARKKSGDSPQTHVSGGKRRCTERRRRGDTAISWRGWVLRASRVGRPAPGYGSTLLLGVRNRLRSPCPARRRASRE